MSVIYLLLILGTPYSAHATRTDCTREAYRINQYQPQLIAVCRRIES